MRGYEAFRYLMYKRDIRKADVIRATGVTRPVLTDWEHGRREPSIRTMRRLADYFNVPVETFIEKGATDEKVQSARR